MEEKKTLGSWAYEQNIRLLDTNFYEDENLYTLEEYTKIIPRDIEVPLNFKMSEEIKFNELLISDGENYILNPSASNKIAEFEKQIKVIKEQEDELKQAILEEMESKKIVKLDTPELTITYVAPTSRETFDSKSFRADHQDLYDEYVKISPVKSSVRFKVK